MIKWGIVGLGNMANKFASAIKDVNNVKLQSVSSLDKKKLEIFKKNFNIQNEYAFNNYDDLIQCKEIDAVYISPLNNTHLDLIKKCAENKKNILCEKPMSLNFDEAKLAKEYIYKHKVSFFEAIAYRTHPQTNIIKDLIEQEEVGEIISIESNFGFKINKIKPESRLFNKKLGGGAILDIGCYPISVLSLISKNKKFNLIKSNGSFTVTGVDDFAEANILIDNKINANIKISFKENLNNQLIFRGKKGSIVVNNPWLPDIKNHIDVSIDNKFYKKFINSEKSLYANQIHKISYNFENSINDDNYSVNIDESNVIMEILTKWDNAIRLND